MQVREWLGEHVAPYWRTLLVVATPFILLPIALSGDSEARCGYVILLMAIFWMTEAVPVPVTALMPVFIFPFLGVLSTTDVCITYMKQTNMMFLGGLTVAIAVEHCNLHKRIALKVLLLVGQSPRMLMAGFMFTTMFLSMWISNTASTAMMVPIVEAILVELYVSHTDQEASAPPEVDASEGLHRQSQLELVPRDTVQSIPYKGKPDTAVSMKAVGSGGEEQGPAGLTTTPPSEQCRALRDMCFLATAYAANLGGTGSVTGTGPNLVMMGLMSSSYSESTGLTFLSWMLFNIPGMIVCVLLAWVWLQVRFLGLFSRKKNSLLNTSEERKVAVRRLVEGKYRELGPMKFQESVVLFLFTLLVMLWVFRQPDFIPGWSAFFHDTFGVEVDDATPAMMIVFLLFVVPARLDFWCFRKPGDPERSPGDNNSCLTWDVVQRKVPWGVVLLLGGGFAMAEGSKQSGLSKWLGEQLYIFNGVNAGVIVLVVSLMTAMMTEVASNTATASIILPVLNELALNIQVNPIYLMLPATICCSYAFMLPVATPPNAIVFSAARMSSSEMMKTGLILNVVCVIVINVMINTLGVAVFDVFNMPAWTNSSLLS